MNSIRKRIADERGMEILQNLMIIGIAALILLLIKLWWPWINEYTDLAINILLEN